MIRKIIISFILFIAFGLTYSVILNNLVFGLILGSVSTIIFFVILIKNRDIQKYEKLNYHELILLCESLHQGAIAKKMFTREYLISCLEPVQHKFNDIGDNYEAIFMRLGEYFIIPEFDVLNDIVVKNYKNYEAMEKALSSYLMLLHFNEKKYDLTIKNSRKKFGGFLTLWILSFSFLVSLFIGFNEYYLKLLDSSYNLLIIGLIVGFNIQYYLCFIYKRKEMAYVIQRNSK